MKDKMKEQFIAARKKASELYAQANAHKLPQGILKALVIVAAFIITGFLVAKLLDMLYTSVCNVIDRHPLGVGLTAAGGGCFFLKYLQIKEESNRRKAEQQRGWDQQKKSMYRGCYDTIAGWLYSRVCSQPNFEDMTSLKRPVHPKDFGNKDRDTYLFDGLAHFRFSIPKSSPDALNTKLLASVLQGLIKQQIEIAGLDPILRRSDPDKLIVKEVEDMYTYVQLVLILDFDDLYLKQHMYENALVEIAERDKQTAAPVDRDYHA